MVSKMATDFSHIMLRLNKSGLLSFYTLLDINFCEKGESLAATRVPTGETRHWESDEGRVVSFLSDQFKLAGRNSFKLAGRN